ncbi:Vacuolar protein sorting-associated protein 62 [Saccharomyces cerevisiae S288c] [Rhizoctonia solani]|uniref:Vacuolar protein sorting-associated protein 62 [Saccharomyces cerevisiae S288c] n=1 Tax=Rhizoctonia solani TaxID=456999 RepID=A0A0K6FUA9_9AGAM|nr:Vacuolar protein sorting-associated protein 62 [Saccharomyces cerevisiae S288c] [Rhizoctonia solani]
MHLRSLLLLALKSISSRITTRAIQTSGDLPEYALVYAPIVYLWSQEEFWPSDPTIHLQHVTAKHSDFSNDTAAPYPLTIANLNYPGSNEDTYLTGNDGVETEPEWLRSTYGKPNAIGKSAAPSAIIAVDKGETIGTGYVDVFYPFFYSFNRGNRYNGSVYGDHVGDWENIMIRFLNGSPQSVHYSQHSDGPAYTYDATPKCGLRPIAYSAGGSHANYATVGAHNHSANFGYLTDHADAGPMWDITLNYVAYWYSTEKGFVGATHNHVSGSWLEFIGHWGDKQYPDSDPRQHSLEGQYRYTSGPPGPIGHNLMRTTLCQYSDCPAQESLGA